MSLEDRADKCFGGEGRGRGAFTLLCFSFSFRSFLLSPCSLVCSFYHCFIFCLPPLFLFFFLLSVIHSFYLSSIFFLSFDLPAFLFFDFSLSFFMSTFLLSSLSFSLLSSYFLFLFFLSFFLPIFLPPSLPPPHPSSSLPPLSHTLSPSIPRPWSTVASFKACNLRALGERLSLPRPTHHRGPAEVTRQRAGREGAGRGSDVWTWDVMGTRVMGEKMREKMR